MSGKYDLTLKLWKTFAGSTGTACRGVPAKINIRGLRYCPEAMTDTVKISSKSPLAEFKNYMQNWRLQGEDFVPKSENPKSTFVEYFNFRAEKCKPKPAQKAGGWLIPARPAQPKILLKDDDVNFPMRSLMEFKNFMQNTSKYATKEEYFEVIEELASRMPQYVRQKYPNLHPKIAERSGDIFRWRSWLDVEKKVDGKLVQTKFYDEPRKKQALEEFTQFVEDLTGKKVLIGSPTRMTIGPDELGLLNDPKSYKDVDYILFGHGKGSSLITDIEKPDTWRFSDTGESVWKFIEENVPKGKRVLVGTCEQDRFWRADGMIPKERKALAEMYDKSGNYMFGIGNTVCSHFTRGQPAKVCESGVRHVLGHKFIEKGSYINDSFIDSRYGDVQSVYYDL